MSAPCLNIIGLVLNIAGVVMVFFYGFPQPSFEKAGGIGVSDNIQMRDGRTVAEHDEERRKKKAHYLRMSRLALGLMILGFVIQLCAAFR